MNLYPNPTAPLIPLYPNSWSVAKTGSGKISPVSTDADDGEVLASGVAGVQPPGAADSALIFTLRMLICSGVSFVDTKSDTAMTGAGGRTSLAETPNGNACRSPMHVSGRGSGCAWEREEQSATRRGGDHALSSRAGARALARQRTFGALARTRKAQEVANTT